MTDLAPDTHPEIRSFEDYERTYFPVQTAERKERDELPFEFGQRVAQDFLANTGR